MFPKKPNQRVLAARDEVLRTLGAAGLLCRGTIVKRTKVCGKSSCKCAQDPKARHGPYYEWGRMQGGRLVHTMISRAQAAEILKAIREHRRIQRLLRKWELESTHELLGLTSHKR